MARKGALYRCFCIIKGCNDVIDPATGERGVLLSLRVFKDHERAENHANKRDQLGEQRREELRQSALAAQARVLEGQEDLLAQTMANLSLDSRTLQPQPGGSPNAKYRNAIKRAKIEQISEVQDTIDQLRGRLEDLRLPEGSRPDTVSDVAILDVLEQCKKLHIRAVELEREINLSDRGEARRDSAVILLRGKAREDLDDFRRQVRDIEEAWDSIRRRREELKREESASGVPQFDSSHHFRLILDGATSIIQLVTLMVVACHVILGLPRRGCTWLYSMCSYIVETTVLRAAAVVPPYFTRILGHFPKDVRTARDQFLLETNATVYAICPECHFTHKPSYKAEFPDLPLYPQKCRAKHRGKRCKEIIVRPKMRGKIRIFVPIMPYVAFDFKDWLAGMLSRTNYEETMDQAWDRMKSPSDEDELLNDVFQGSVIREFKGFDKATHFSEIGEKDSGRYVFSLACDFFNPLRNLTGGKKVSVGVMAVICLNLPIHLRYRPENIFLAGIIPGPKEPSLDAINNFLKPIVDDFLELWTGVRFSQTCLYPLGRMIFCAIVAVICDLPAARKFGGFASFHHVYYCSVCWCNKTERSYNSFDYGSWRMRSDEECRDWARKYREAHTAAEAESFFDRSGVRSTELLRLPYYDPCRFLVIDPMHNLFLGLIKEHFQNILGNHPRRKSDECEAPSAGVHIEIPQDGRNPIPSSKHGRAGVRKLLDWLAEPITFDSADHAAIVEVVTLWSGNRISLAALMYVARGVGCIEMEREAQTDDTEEGTGQAAEDNITIRNGGEGINEHGASFNVNVESQNEQDGREDGPASTVPHLPSRSNEKKSLTKRDVARLLLNWRLRQVESPMPSIECGSVFTQAEMQAIRHDIEQMIKPSWISSVPVTVSSSGPKLKSDEWRVFGSLYLPVTLIRLWSDCSDDDEDGKERRDLLDLTMLLLSAIAVASSRVTSRRHAEEYLTHMIAYRQKLRQIFPAYKCHPNHHVAMHVGELLLMYGPMHNWWTFPLERMIGTLQRMSTNYKPGEYEETISRSWYRSSNFRALFARTTCPQPIRLCADMFEVLIRSDKRNTLGAVSDLLDNNAVTNESVDWDADDGFLEVPGEETLDRDLADALANHYTRIPKTAKVVKRMTLADGTSYTTRGTHEGNSCIMIKGQTLPYCIEKILQIQGPEAREDVDIWLVARAHKDLETDDPYRIYPRLRAKIWSAELDDAVAVIHISCVETHFAKRNISWKGQRAIVAVSLSRVHPL